jgi:ribosomal protein S10
MVEKFYKCCVTLELHDPKYFDVFQTKLNKLKRAYKWRKRLFVFEAHKVKKKKKKFTTLKSPHVNKKSQEKFQQVRYKYTFKIISSELESLYEFSNRIFLISDFQSKIYISVVDNK